MNHSHHRREDAADSHRVGTHRAAFRSKQHDCCFLCETAAKIHWQRNRKHSQVLFSLGGGVDYELWIMDNYGKMWADNVEHMWRACVTAQCLIRSYITAQILLRTGGTMVGDKQWIYGFTGIFFQDSLFCLGFFLHNDWEVFHIANNTHKHLVIIFWFVEGGKRKQKMSPGSRLLSSRRFLVSVDRTPCLRTEK